MAEANPSDNQSEGPKPLSELIPEIQNRLAASADIQQALESVDRRRKAEADLANLEQLGVVIQEDREAEETPKADQPDLTMERLENDAKIIDKRKELDNLDDS